MKPLARVYKPYGKTEGPRIPQPFALGLMFSACSAFMSPFSLEVTSVSWTDFHDIIMVTSKTWILALVTAKDGTAGNGQFSLNCLFCFLFVCLFL